MKLLDIVYETVLGLNEMPAKLTQNEFIKKAEKKHGGKYKYNNVNYINSTKHVTITCLKHGNFSQNPSSHLMGSGCPKCSIENHILNNPKPKMTTNDFIKKSKEVHGDKYSYGNTDYVNDKTKVRITCPKHGDFLQLPTPHKNGSGCPVCAIKNSTSNRTGNTNDFILKSKKIHGNDRYDYKNVNYIKSGDKVEIICNRKDRDGNEHGPFLQVAGSHLNGAGCPKCKRDNKISNTYSFIEKAEKKHRGKYDYSEVEYVSNREPIKIICHKKNRNGIEHGVFLQSPNNHLAGYGCPICQEPMGEKKIKHILNDNGIEFIEQKVYNDCLSYLNKVNNKCHKLKFDFFIPKQNTLIEFDGIYHFEKKRDTQNIQSQIMNDREKNNYTKLKNIKLIRLSYLDIKNLETEIINGLNSKDQLFLSSMYPQNKGWRDTTIKV
jgi:hypothetical protein